MNKIGKKSTFSGNMGRGTYIGAESDIHGNIGRFTSIGTRVKSVSGVHPLAAPFATTSPLFYSTSRYHPWTFAKKQAFNEHRYADEQKKIPLLVGSDVWIGYGVTIIDGVTIGDGAVILAGAVVTVDIPPYAIAGGVPARVIKYRYNDDTIRFLLSIKWWDKPLAWLARHHELLLDIDKLRAHFKNDNPPPARDNSAPGETPPEN